MLRQLLSGPVDEVARRLLGCELKRTLPDGTTLVGRIVETEAYGQADAASHSYKGRTLRNEVMFGPPGRLYVYFTYGMHYCCNIVTGPEGEGAAVLIRAVEPLQGQAVMAAGRSGKASAGQSGLTNGPAKLCQALAIDKALNGHDLDQSPLRLIIRPELPSQEITQTTRIGISQATELPLRFYIVCNAYVSRL